MRFRMSADIRERPPRHWIFQRQWSREPPRRRRTTISGRTAVIASKNFRNPPIQPDEEQPIEIGKLRSLRRRAPQDIQLMPQDDNLGLESHSWLKRRRQKVYQKIQQVPHGGRLPNQPLPASPDEVCDRDTGKTMCRRAEFVHLHQNCVRATVGCDLTRSDADCQRTGKRAIRGLKRSAALLPAASGLDHLRSARVKLLREGSTATLTLGSPVHPEKV